MATVRKSITRGDILRGALTLRAKRIIDNRKAASPPSSEPIVIDQKEVVIRASQITLVVDTFSPVFNLNPTIDVTSPDVRVDVASPNVTVSSPNVTVDNRPDIQVNVPQQAPPSITNQITVPEPSVKEVNVSLSPPANGSSSPHRPARIRKITVTGPNGEYTGIVSEESSGGNGG